MASDERDAVTLELASKLEVAISAAHSAGASEPQLKPFIDMVDEWKASASVSEPLMKPADAPAPMPEPAPIPSMDAPKDKPVKDKLDKN